MIFYKNILLKRVHPDSHINYIVLSDCQTHVTQKLGQFMCVPLELPSLPPPAYFHPTPTKAGFLKENNLIRENAQTLIMTHKSLAFNDLSFF